LPGGADRLGRLREVESVLCASPLCGSVPCLGLFSHASSYVGGSNPTLVLRGSLPSSRSPARLAPPRPAQPPTTRPAVRRIRPRRNASTFAWVGVFARLVVSDTCRACPALSLPLAPLHLVLARRTLALRGGPSRATPRTRNWSSSFCPRGSPTGGTGSCGWRRPVVASCWSVSSPGRQRTWPSLRLRCLRCRSVRLARGPAAWTSTATTSGTTTTSPPSGRFFGWPGRAVAPWRRRSSSRLVRFFRWLRPRRSS
jgi:hypothetical protein